MLRRCCQVRYLQMKLFINHKFITNYQQLLYCTNEAKQNKSLIEDKIKSKTKFLFTWKSFLVAFGFGGIAVIGINYLKSRKDKQIENSRNQQLGKMLIGGDWKLINTEGKQVTNKDFLGKWVLLYFGFTHCPDICPDEIEKMCQVVDSIHSENSNKSAKNNLDILPLFVSIDPERDTPNIVKQYCEEFSSKLIGLTGTPEDINHISKTFRVYYSQGPRDKRNDYIVDHTIITYLIDPNGKFVDYFGRTKTHEDMEASIKLHAYKFNKSNKLSFFS